MQIVIAPQAFKGTLPAGEVAKAMQEGVLRALPDARTFCVPVADGGDGTLTSFCRRKRVNGFKLL